MENEEIYQINNDEPVYNSNKDVNTSEELVYVPSHGREMTPQEHQNLHENE